MFYEKLAQAKQDKNKELGKDNSAYTKHRRRNDNLGIALGAAIPGALAYDYSSRPLVHIGRKFIPDDIEMSLGDNLMGDTALKLKSNDMDYAELSDTLKRYTKNLNRARIGVGLTTGLVGGGLMKMRADRREREYQARRQERLNHLLRS
jgi:hypothetical protein